LVVIAFDDAMKAREAFLDVCRYCDEVHGQELWALAQDGWEPTCFLFDFLRYHVWHVTPQFVFTGEVTEATVATDLARRTVQSRIQAQAAAYAPYSNYEVGAALECADGSVYTCCNIENCSYGGTVCAERTALWKAVSEGQRAFRRIVICTDGDTENRRLAEQFLGQTPFWPRIDYHVVNAGFLPRVERAWIDCEILGSDHCPVGIEVAA